MFSDNLEYESKHVYTLLLRQVFNMLPLALSYYHSPFFNKCHKELPKLHVCVGISVLEECEFEGHGLQFVNSFTYS